MGRGIGEDNRKAHGLSRRGRGGPDIINYSKLLQQAEADFEEENLEGFYSLLVHVNSRILNKKEELERFVTLFNKVISNRYVMTDGDLAEIVLKLGQLRREALEVLDTLAQDNVSNLPPERPQLFLYDFHFQYDEILFSQQREGLADSLHILKDNPLLTDYPNIIKHFAQGLAQSYIDEYTDQDNSLNDLISLFDHDVEDTPLAFVAAETVYTELVAEEYSRRPLSQLAQAALNSESSAFAEVRDVAESRVSMMSAFIDKEAFGRIEHINKMNLIRQRYLKYLLTDEEGIHPVSHVFDPRVFISETRKMYGLPAKEVSSDFIENWDEIIREAYEQALIDGKSYPDAMIDQLYGIVSKEIGPCKFTDKMLNSLFVEKPRNSYDYDTYTKALEKFGRRKLNGQKTITHLLTFDNNHLNQRAFGKAFLNLANRANQVHTRDILLKLIESI